MSQAVTVGKYQVRCGGGENGPVEDQGFTKTVIRVPDVPQGIRCAGGGLVNHLGCFRTGPVVGNDDLKIPVGLVIQRVQAALQVTRLVLG